MRGWLVSTWFCVMNLLDVSAASVTPSNTYFCGDLRCFLFYASDRDAQLLSHPHSARRKWLDVIGGRADGALAIDETIRIKRFRLVQWTGRSAACHARWYVSIVFKPHAFSFSGSASVQRTGCSVGGEHQSGPAAFATSTRLLLGADRRRGRRSAGPRACAGRS